MDRLKSILVQALSASASRIKIQVGEGPEILTSQGAQKPKREAKFSQADVDLLFGFLFPNDGPSLAQGKVVKGILNVPKVGKIQLIGLGQPPQSLRLYIPGTGQALFESDWQRFNSPTVAPQQPKPAKPSPNAGGFIPMTASPAGEDQGDSKRHPSQKEGVKDPRKAIPFVLDDSNDSPIVKDRKPIEGSIATPSSVIGAPTTDSGMSDHAAIPPVHGSQTHEPPVVVGNSSSSPMPIPVVPKSQSENSDDGFPVDSVSPEAKTSLKTLTPEPISYEAEKQGEKSVSQGSNPIDIVLMDMVNKRASDLHLTTGEPICFRVDGEIERQSSGPLTPEIMKSFIEPITPSVNYREFSETDDTDFAYEIKGVGRFRVNLFRDRTGVGCVMRHIPSEILTAEQLALPKAITNFCELSKGLVVVTGPTGSGKSTTLAAMIDVINKTRNDHILTIEDPIEFVHPQHKCLVNQREVHKHTTSFARALKAALREDPDIVLIGEMRDLETIAIAIETAETGHLVFGTLHTTTAVSTIDRIIDQFPADQQEQIRMMVAGSLKGVVAQTLLKKKGGGRVAAHEILVTADAVSAMIREGKNHMIKNHMQSQKADGNILLNESLVNLVRQGLVDPNQAFLKAVEKASLVEAFMRSGIPFERDKIKKTA